MAEKIEKNAEKQEKAPVNPEIEKQLADYKDSLQRLQAEFENYKKRVDKEKAQLRHFAFAEMARTFLPVLDSFELALKSINCCKIPEADSKIVKGMEILYGQFYGVLESGGLRPIKALGEKLDPYRHEVLLQEDTDDEKKDCIVVEEFQKGYMFNDIIIRCSKVKVLKFVGKGEKK
jgi:molecular chaperone GrpE